ncbi:MAG: cyclic nucleotide-binding domain-containing protein [Pseudomonadota bacterium]
MPPVTIEEFKNLEPLSTLSAQHAEELARLCNTVKIKRGVNPFTLEILDRCTLYLLKGQLRLVSTDFSDEVLVAGADSDNFAIDKRSSRYIEAKAITDIEMMYIDSDTLDVMLTWDQLTGPRGKNSAKEITDWRVMSGVLAAENLSNGVFASLPSAHIDALLKRFDLISASAGQQVICEGDEGDYYYIIESGRCRVTRQVGATQVQVAELKAGDAFGEEALVANTTRNASVTMKTDGVLLRIAKADFIELLREPLLQRLSLQESQQKVARGAIWIDVRFPSEYRNDKLTGAINVPVNEIRDLFNALDRNNEYIVYCQSGRRSSAAAFLLAQYGYKAYVLEGGLWTLPDATRN